MFESMNCQTRFLSPFPEFGRRERHMFAAGPGGHGRRGHRRRGMDNRQRMHRGDIKYLLLSLLAEQSQHGYQLIKELESRWGGFYRPSPGSVYPTLQLLEEGGYLSSEQAEGKRIYTITDSGRELLAEHQGSFETRNKIDEQPQLLELKNTLQDLHEAIRQVTRSGHENHIGTVLERLKQLKREIYKMLAEEE